MTRAQVLAVIFVAIGLFAAGFWVDRWSHDPEFKVQFQCVRPTGAGTQI